MAIVKTVDLEDGVPVVWVGVHVLRWRSEWGEPSIGFDHIDPNITNKLFSLLETLLPLSEDIVDDPEEILNDTDWQVVKELYKYFTDE